MAGPTESGDADPRGESSTGHRRPRTARLFVALDLPAAARAALAEFRDAADPRVWRPVPDEALHVTLVFLGHLPEGTSARVGEIVRACAGPAADLALGPGLLLPPRRARVLTVEVEDRAGALGALQARLAEALAEAGVYEPERRAFRPHATVARLRSGERAPRSLRGDEPARVEFSGEAVTLYRSRLSRAGARYEPLERVVVG
jgi:RNA 2',3'-cyclic 3'-phosphodiesterase